MKALLLTSLFVLSLAFPAAAGPFDLLGGVANLVGGALKTTTHVVTAPVRMTRKAVSKKTPQTNDEKLAMEQVREVQR